MRSNTSRRAIRPTRHCSSSWGLGAQLTTWPDGFVDGLRQRGFYVIRYDNRDSGLSTKFEGMPDIAALFTGTDLSSTVYRIEDMADDGAALLGVLGITRRTWWALPWGA